MKWKLVVLLVFLSSPVMAQGHNPLDGRANVMECSHSEVMAYMELPNPERRAMRDYFAWQTAYKQVEAVKAETDPAACLGMLYGDLSAYGAQLKQATEALLNMSPPDMGSIVRSQLSGMFDKLTESICKRAKAAVSEVDKVISEEIGALKKQSLRELDKRYGKRAMDKYMTDSLPPAFKEKGLRFRNGTIDQSKFQRDLRKQWSGVLDEMGGI